MCNAQQEKLCPYPSDTNFAIPSPSVVLILGLGAGSQAFIEELLTRGIKVVALDQAPQLTPEFLSSPLARNLTLLPHDFSDLTAVADAIARYHVTHTLALPVGRSLIYLGQINERYNFTGPRTQAIDTCTDKHKFHQLLKQHDLSAPRQIVLGARTHGLGLTPNELTRAHQELGFPLVVKPACGSGSQGVRYCAQAEDLASYCVPERFAAGELLLEQAIDGTEYSTNFFVDAQGAIHMLGIFAKEMSALPYRQEVTYFVANYEQAFAHIYPAITRLVAALGSACHNSFFNCDVIVAPSGEAYLIDVSPRLGGNVLILLEKRYGINPIELFVRHVITQEPLDDLAPTGTLPKPHTCAVMRFLSFSCPATVTGFKSKLTDEERSHLIIEQNHLKVGDQVGPLRDGSGIKHGMILVEHEELAEANRISQRYLDSFELQA